MWWRYWKLFKNNKNASGKRILTNRENLLTNTQLFKGIDKFLAMCYNTTKSARWLRGLPRGKSEHRRTGCRLTAGEGNFKESATEIYRQIIGKVERAR